APATDAREQRVLFFGELARQQDRARTHDLQGRPAFLRPFGVDRCHLRTSHGARWRPNGNVCEGRPHPTKTPGRVGKVLQIKYERGVSADKRSSAAMAIL